VRRAPCALRISDKRNMSRRNKNYTLSLSRHLCTQRQTFGGLLYLSRRPDT
jgi:hypothetical protein